MFARGGIKAEHQHLIITLLLTVGVFYGLMFAPWLSWDDDANIFANPIYREGQWLAFWQQSYFGLYVPLISTIWGGLYHLGGGETWPFRLMNLALHLINMVLVYKLLMRWAAQVGQSVFLVAIGVAIFALHPVQVHTVAWISGGRDLLATNLALIATLIWQAQRPKTAVAVFGLSLLAKPSVVMWPVLVAFIDFAIERRLRPSRRWLWLTAPMVLASVVLTYRAQVDHLATALSVTERLRVVADTYGFYLAKLFVPYPLSANYGRTPQVALNDSLMWPLVAILIFSAFLFLAFWRDRRYLFLVVWALALAPVSGIVSFAFQRISTVSDHYLYWPMLFWSAWAMTVLSRLKFDRLPARVGYVLLLGLWMALMLASMKRVEVWRSNSSFFRDMAVHAPQSYSTAIGMSVVLCEEEKSYVEGVMWTERALKARPLDMVALANQAYCHLHAKNYLRVIEMESLLNQLDLKAMETKSPTSYTSFLATLGTALIEQQQYEAGYQYICESARILPTHPRHLQNLKAATEILRRQGLVAQCR